MVNISIISNCNNNCEYCFQKDSYHDLNKMLEYDEILNILKWSRGDSRIGILGGEPTLHPDCIKICKTAAEEFNTIIFTNLLCKGSILEELVKIQPMGWLVNSTTRHELADMFEDNISYLNNLRTFHPISFGITLVGNLESDLKWIENLVRLGKKYTNVVANYRIALATPCHDKEFKLKRYDKSIAKIYEVAKKETPHMTISFDCCVNNCLMSHEMMLRLLQDPRTRNLKFTCPPQPRVDVMSDRSINFCGSVPDEIFTIRDYRKFDDWRECGMYIMRIREEFMEKYSHFCKVSKYCQDKSCSGACFASLANLVKQEQKKSKLTQNYHEVRYKFSEWKKQFGNYNLENQNL